MRLLCYSILPLFFLLSGCRDEKATSVSLRDAEKYISSCPDSAIALLDDIPDPEGLNDKDFARWCLLRGQISDEKHTELLPVYQWKRAYAYLSGSGSAKEQAQIALYLGRAYMEDGEYDRAMQIYDEALQFANVHKEYNVAGYICTYMADLYNFREMAPKVREKYEDAIAFFLKAKNLKSQAYALKNLAMEWVLLNNFLTAEKLLKQADSLANVVDIPRLKYNMANAYANFYLFKKDFAMAESYFKKAIKLDDRKGIKDSLGLINVYVVTGRLNEAEKIADGIAKCDSESYHIHHSYYIINKAKGNYEDALYYKERYTDMLDSLSEVKNNTKILEIEHKYRNAQLREENGQLKIIRQRIIILLTICISFLLIIGLLFVLYRQRIKVRTYYRNAQMNKMKMELSLLTIELNEKKKMLDEWVENQENIERLQQKIEVLSAQYRQIRWQHLESMAIRKKLSTLVAKNVPATGAPLVTEKLWILLISELKKTCPDFYASLSMQSNLTEEEWRYCCLHILGFDGNNEAKLLNIIPSSIWTKRNRIKQKLGFTHEKQLGLREILIKHFL